MNQTSINDKVEFQAVKEQDRAEYIRNVLKVPQLKGVPKLLEQSYTGSSTFFYKQYKIHYYYEKVTDQPAALLLLFHGMNSHGGKSGYFGVNIAKNTQINVYSLDFLNFGKSQGDLKGYIHSFEECVNQAESFAEHISSLYQQTTPLFLCGMSLGGSISLKMSLRNPQRYKGIILLNPALRQLKEERYYLKKIGRFLGYLFPRYSLLTQREDNATKYNIEAIIRADEYNYTGPNVLGSVRIVLTAMQEIQKTFASIEVPYLLFQGGMDKLIDLFAPLDMEKQSKSTDKTTIYYKNMWHSVFYEEEIEQIWPICVDWLKKRI